MREEGNVPDGWGEVIEKVNRNGKKMKTLLTDMFLQQ
jgi:hypothetical protein